MQTKLSRLVAAAAISMALVPATSTAQPSTLEGRIVHVEDGDTVVLLDANRVQHKIRLADIDAPETCHRQRDPACTRKPGQPFGDKSRQALEALIKGQQAVARCRGAVNPGRDDRQVCFINVGASGGGQPESVNYKLVKQGMAWVEPRFAKDPLLHAIGADARAKRIGLWSMPNPIEPRDWRGRCWAKGDCPQ